MKKVFNPKLQKLKQMQSLPLEQKIIMTKKRIREWHEHYEGQVYVSFSGGADSTVLLHLVRSVFPDVKGIFCNTGLEHAQIVRFVRSCENVEIIRPKFTYKQVIEKYGYPIISKEVATHIHEIRTTKSQKLKDLRMGKVPGRLGKLPLKWNFLLDAPFKISGLCCSYLKKQPFKSYDRKNDMHPYIGVMAEESLLRVESYIKYSCNAFDQKNPQSRPLMFWTKQDILQYILKYEVDYCNAVYGEIIKDSNTGLLKFSGADRTGCTFCMFGVHLEPYPNRFQRMQTENPALYNYCMNELNLKQVLEYCHIPYDKNDYGAGLQLSFEFEEDDEEAEGDINDL